MDPDLFIPFLLFFGGLALTVVLAAASAWLRQQRIQTGWGAFASRSGLMLSGVKPLGMPTVEGEYRQRRVRLRTYVQRSGRSSTRYTEITLGVPEAGSRTLTLRREGALDALGKTLGMKDIPTGDAGFDGQMILQASSPEWAQSILAGQDMLRHDLTRIPRLSLTLRGGVLAHREMGLQTDPDRLSALLEALSGLADAIERREPGRDEFAEEEAPDAEAEEAETAGAEDDPFYRRAPEPEPVYPYAPAGGTGFKLSEKMVLVGAFVLLDLIIAIAVVVFFLLR